MSVLACSSLSDNSSGVLDHISGVQTNSAAVGESESVDARAPKEEETTLPNRQYKLSNQIQKRSIESSIDSSVESVMRKNGLEELGVGNTRKRVLPARELQSHVPSEVTVTKYGYIENRVIGVLDDILDHGGFFSTPTRKSVTFGRIELSQNGRDINVQYRIHRMGSEDAVLSSLHRSEDEDYEDFDAIRASVMVW